MGTFLALLIGLAALPAAADAGRPAAEAAASRSREALASGRLEEALIHASEAVTADPSWPDAFLQRAQVRRALIRRPGPASEPEGSVDAGALLADLDEAVRLAPRSTAALVVRAEVRRFELQDSTAALQDYDRALRLDSAGVNALIGRSEALRMQGRYDEAIADADRARPREPVIGWVQRARVLAEREDYKGAAEAVASAAAAGDLARAPLPEGTLDFLRAAAEAADARRTLVESLAANGGADAAAVEKARRDALAAHGMAAALFPGRAAGYVGRAEVLRVLGDVEGARREIALAVERAPEDPEGYVARARLAEREGRKDAARADWIRAAELQVRRRAAAVHNQ